MKKICTKCKKAKDETDFSVTKVRGRMLRRSWCDACMREYYKAYNLSKTKQENTTVKPSTLNDLLVCRLHDLYNMENQIIKALPKMVKTATCPELRGAFESHLEETKHQAERLEQIFEKLNVSSRGKKCTGMEGILEEGKDFIGEGAEGDVMDAGLIAAAQHVEHYEMAGYGCARTWAEQLGMHDVAELLRESLDEEKAADEKLTSLAEESINQEAMAGVGHEGAETSRRSRAKRG